eukprot:COSAG02_NODE_2607_length_8436_cov_3.451841_12_plen_66_part_00
MESNPKGCGYGVHLRVCAFQGPRTMILNSMEKPLRNLDCMLPGFEVIRRHRGEAGGVDLKISNSV